MVSLSTPTVFASAAEVAAGISGKAVDPASLKYAPTAVKAWVKFSVSGGVVTVNSSYNIASVVRNSAADFTISFTNAMVDANYVVSGTVKLTAGGTFVVIVKNGTTPTTGAFNIITPQFNNVLTDPTDVYVEIIGN